jgi:hypothetical protein
MLLARGRADSFSGIKANFFPVLKVETMSEALLPNTDAIKRNTLEWDNYCGKWLVRYKNGAGQVHRVLTPSWEEANTAFEKFLKEMREQAAGSL